MAGNATARDAGLLGVARAGPLTRELLLVPGAFGLGHLPARAQPDATTRTICGYCSTGCSLDVHLKDNTAIGLSPTVDHPVNLGMACPKGWEALSVLNSPDRATTPLLRSEGGRLEPVRWEQAAETFVARMKSIQAAHGSEAVAFLSTGQIATEEMALLGALAKFGMGMLHGDGNTRQCMATAVVAYQESFGFDAPPFTYEDFELSDVLVFVGSNVCIAHPIMWERVMRNPHDPQIVVIDPRATETAMAATQHLPVRPKSDLTLLYGVAKLLVDRDWICPDYIAGHTSDFEAFRAFLGAFPIDRVVAETGIAAGEIERLARTIHDGQSVSFWWTMGVNQSHQGVRTAQALINLALMTGNIGRPGTGANSITGQCNAMGSRLFSNTTNLLGGRAFDNDAHRREVADILEIDEGRIPRNKGWSYDRIMEGILAGKIRGLWVICTNPAHSWINQSQARDILERLDFLVVQDMYATTETAEMADLVLPAAGWGEKEGTFINSERRIGLHKKVAQAPGVALADFAIFKLLAEYWGCGEMFRRWHSPEAVFQILKRLSAGRPCDFSGIDDYRMLDRAGGIQWPYRDEQRDGRPQRRLFGDGRYYHADGKARFVFEETHAMPEPPSEKYPFLLLTGRGSASQWHTQTRTAKSAVLRKLYPGDPYVEISPSDAAEHAIERGQWVRISSQRGSIRAKAVVLPSVQPGQVFVPMHDAQTNLLTDAVFDPYSRQPAYKACAVSLDAMPRTAPR